MELTEGFLDRDGMKPTTGQVEKSTLLLLCLLMGLLLTIMNGTQLCRSFASILEY